MYTRDLIMRMLQNLPREHPCWLPPELWVVIDSMVEVTDRERMDDVLWNLMVIHKKYRHLIMEEVVYDGGIKGFVTKRDSYGYYELKPEKDLRLWSQIEELNKLGFGVEEYEAYLVLRMEISGNSKRLREYRATFGLTHYGKKLPLRPDLDMACDDDPNITFVLYLQGKEGRERREFKKEYKRKQLQRMSGKLPKNINKFSYLQ